MKQIVLIFLLQLAVNTAFSQGNAKNLSLLTQFPEAELPYETPNQFFSLQYEEVEDPEEETGYKQIHMKDFPDLFYLLGFTDEQVFAVNKLILNEQTLIVIYVNTYSKISGDEVNYYKGVLLDNSFEFTSDILLSDQFTTMRTANIMESSSTTSKIYADDYSDDYLVNVYTETEEKNYDVEHGAIYKEAFTTYWKIYSNGDIQDVTNYWRD